MFCEQNAKMTKRYLKPRKRRTSSVCAKAHTRFCADILFVDAHLKETQRKVNCILDRKEYRQSCNCLKV